MEKFHFNPISMKNDFVHLFSHIQTLFIYKKEDEVLEGGIIENYSIQYDITYDEYLKIKENHPNKNIQFKKIILTQNDVKIENNKYYKKYGVQMNNFEFQK